MEKKRLNKNRFVKMKRKLLNSTPPSLSAVWTTPFHISTFTLKDKVRPRTLLKSSLVALISFQVLLSSWMQMQKNSSKERSWVKNMGWKSWQFSLAGDEKKIKIKLVDKLSTQNSCSLKKQEFIFVKFKRRLLFLFCLIVNLAISVSFSLLLLNFFWATFFKRYYLHVSI